jgi:hypothetical protein
MVLGTEKVPIETLNLMAIEPAILFAGGGIDLEALNIAERPWSSVYTSQNAIDALRCFNNASRRVSDISTLEYVDEFRLNRTDLPIIRLCGIASVVTDEILQDQVQLAALEKLPKLLCDYGHIFFAGKFSADTIKNFCLKILGLDRRQIVLFFGLSAEDKTNIYVKRLIEKEKAIVFEDGLSESLHKISESLEEYDFESLKAEAKSDVTIYVSGKPVNMGSDLDKEVLLNVKPFAQLLNINDVERSDVFPASEKIQRFASFLQNSTNGFPQWYGYRQNNSFHIYRYFEDDLYKRTN